MKEMIDYPYITFGVSRRRRAHQVPDRRPLPDRGYRNFVRERRWLTLEEIHWRLSALPAFCAGFKDRGFLREGAPADIVVYDFDKARRRAGRDRARPAGQRMASRAARGRLPPYPGQRRGDLHRGRLHGRYAGQAAASRRGRIAAARVSGHQNNEQRPPAHIASAAVAHDAASRRLQVKLEFAPRQTAADAAMSLAQLSRNAGDAPRRAR